ncbi:MAG: phenylalanine--tRNA ligase subunit alpha [Nanopusillaceae archaeon]
MISNVEYKILKSLDENWKSLEELSKELNLDEYKILRSLGFLKSKNLVDLKDEKKKYYFLSNLGKKYLKIGLPERRLLNYVRERGEVKLEELREIFDSDELNFALGYLKKKDAVEIKDEKVIFKRDIKTEEDILEKIEKGIFNESELKIFLNRKNIIEVKEKTIYYAKINEKGKEFLKSYNPEDYIDNYTKEILDKKIWKYKKFRSYDINIEVPPSNIGKYNKYLEFLDKIRFDLVSMGFEEIEDYRIVLSHFWNLDSLFIPQDHPAGDISLMDTYYLKNPKSIEDFPKELFDKVKRQHLKYFNIWEDNVAKHPILVSHDTAFSAIKLLKSKIPGKYFIIEKVFRYDTIDAKHFIEFNQLDGIILDENITFRDLLGILKEIVINIVGTEDIKFYPAFFPFTEPSVEIYAKHEKLGWMEIGGAGIFRRELLEPFNINVPVIAWGLGIDRLAMLYLNIEDIRELHTKNIRKIQD